MGEVTVLLGSQWGDEGKGKLTDYLLSSNKFEICARAQGGHNAGHSVKTGGKTYSFHLLPSGLINPKTDNLIGSGVVFNVEAFFKEITDLEAQSVPNVRERIHVSSRCALNFELHGIVDALQEQELGKSSRGTTRRGIGPSYSSSVARENLRVIDIYNDSFEPRFRTLAEGYRKRYGSLLDYSVDAEVERFKKHREELAPFIVDAVDYIRDARTKKRPILVESSQALLLDQVYGTYPYCTSSICSIGGCISGLALSPFDLKEIIGVVKSYTTRVGAGPMPSEQFGEIGNLLQERGGEIGVSTGRRRRCGWLDLVVLKHSVGVNHYTSINLTKLDVLDDISPIRVGVAYRTSSGEKIETFPADLNLLENCTVEYVDLEGWKCDTSKARSWEELPMRAQKYIEFIEESIGVSINWIGVGGDREAMVIRKRI